MGIINCAGETPLDLGATLTQVLFPLNQLFNSLAAGWVGRCVKRLIASFPFPKPVLKTDFPPKFVRLLLKLPSMNLHSAPGKEPRPIKSTGAVDADIV
jgi:hypothetical protein